MVVGISTGGFVGAEAHVIMPVRVEQDIGKLDLSLIPEPVYTGW